MTEFSAIVPIESDDDQTPIPADINITAQGDRRTLEALYLEVRELAKEKGLRVEYRLMAMKPADHSDC
jgi:hypothetical protein